MKRTRKPLMVVFLGVFIALVVIAIGGMNMRILINSDGLTGTTRKASSNEATAGDVLENYTFTNSSGIGLMGSITDYSQSLTQLKLLASSANQTVTLPLNPGYYTQVKLDTTEVYDKGYDDGVEDTAKTWVYDHATQTVTKGNVTLNIGDTINYTAPVSSGYTGAWQVLGVDQYRAIKISFSRLCTESNNFSVTKNHQMEAFME